MSTRNKRLVFSPRTTRARRPGTSSPTSGSPRRRPTRSPGSQLTDAGAARRPAAGPTAARRAPLFLINHWVATDPVPRPRTPPRSTPRAPAAPGPHLPRLRQTHAEPAGGELLQEGRPVPGGGQAERRAVRGPGYSASSSIRALTARGDVVPYGSHVLEREVRSGPAGPSRCSACRGCTGTRRHSPSSRRHLRCSAHLAHQLFVGFFAC